MKNNQKTYYRREGAAQYLTEKYGFPCSVAWLAKLASTGGGPVFRKAGKFPLYSTEDLDVWAESRMSEPYKASGVPIKNGKSAR